MSLVLGTFVFPMWAAKNPSAVRGLRQAVVGFAAWVAIYVGLLSVMTWY